MGEVGVFFFILFFFVFLFSFFPYTNIDGLFCGFSLVRLTTAVPWVFCRNLRYPMLQHANIARNAFRPIRLVRPSKENSYTNISMGRFSDVVKAWGRKDTDVTIAISRNK